MNIRLASRGPRRIGRWLVATVPCVVLLAAARPASALVVDPFFSGHGTIDATTQVWQYAVYTGIEYLPGEFWLDIDVPHGMVDDGGLISQMPPGDWNVDMHVWAPLLHRVDITQGGLVTYGNPVPGVFAATWVNVVSADDPAVRNTFQVVFVGTSGFHTDQGLAIAPGSVIFAYGSPTDPQGTVNLSAATPAAIGVLTSSLTTLQALGIGDANGVITTADLAALRSSGDPFLFNQGPSGLEPPVAFASVPDLGATTAVQDPPAGVTSLMVSPNPLHGETTIAWSLARSGRVRLEVYDVAGRPVATLADGVESAGPHQRSWDARGRAGQRLATGLYLVRLAGDRFVETRKVLFVP